MKKHYKEALQSTDCPFALDFKAVTWEKVTKILSVDDSENTVIVLLSSGEKYLVDIPDILYNAIFKSGEENVIEQDLGFDDLT